MKKIIFAISILTINLLLISSCNFGGMSSQEKMLISHPWKLDASETVKNATNSIKDATGLDANVNINKGVETVLDLVTEKIIFTSEKDEKSGKYKYTSIRGNDLLNYEKKGTWKYDSDKKAITMTLEGKEAATYSLVEITDEKLILKSKNNPANYVYLAVK